jgi:hypothetical protein
MLGCAILGHKKQRHEIGETILGNHQLEHDSRRYSPNLGQKFSLEKIFF